MGAQGTATLDFGSFPGKSDTSVAVTGQASIVAGSLVEAWIRPADTADHLADEHMVETIRVVAGSIVAGTGFTIYGFNTNQISEPEDPGQLRGRFSGTGTFPGPGKAGPGEVREAHGGAGTRLYGQWTVAWVWN